MRNSFLALRDSYTLKAAGIGLLILILLVPVAMIRSVINDRQAIGWQARQEIMRSWGNPQTIGGPILVLPYELVRVTQYGERIGEEGQLQILPEYLSVDAELVPELRYRGLHKVPVYTAKMVISGSFASPDWSGLGIDSAELQWDRAAVAVSLSDPRSIRNAPILDIDGSRTRFSSAGNRITGLPPQIVAPLSHYGDQAGRSSAMSFSLTFDVGGTDSIRYLPLGDTTTVSMRSSWPSPSFAGGYLPESRDISESGFTAEWRVSSFGRPLPSRWIGELSNVQINDLSALGVDLFVPVGLYQLSDRATKYAIMFIGLTFVACFLFEVLAGLRLHPLQYLLVGFGNAIFYLLLLSLAEHVGFGVAYLLSVLAASSLVAGYSIAILGDRTRAAAMLAVLLTLYGYLYLTLRAETYAMLAGSIGLWLCLATIMYLTRRIDWYGHAAEIEHQT